MSFIKEFETQNIRKSHKILMGTRTVVDPVEYVHSISEIRQGIVLFQAHF